MKYTCSMETVQQNGRFTLFSSKFHSNIYSILYNCNITPSTIIQEMSNHKNRLGPTVWVTLNHVKPRKFSRFPDQNVRQIGQRVS